LRDPQSIKKLTHSSGKYWSFPKFQERNAGHSHVDFPDPEEHLLGFIVGYAAPMVISADIPKKVA